MKILKTILAFCFLITTMSVVGQNEKDMEIMKKAEEAKNSCMNKDADISKFYESAAGYVIFPSVGKAGLIVGGASGNGVLYENGKAIGMADLKKLNVGLQAGAQSITEVIFFEDEKALNDFKDGDFELDAGISAVALDKGKAKTANYKDGVVVFAMPNKGLMADATVGGQKFSYKPFDMDDMEEMDDMDDDDDNDDD